MVIEDRVTRKRLLLNVLIAILFFIGFSRDKVISSIESYYDNDAIVCNKALFVNLWPKFNWRYSKNSKENAFKENQGRIAIFEIDSTLNDVIGLVWHKLRL